MARRLLLLASHYGRAPIACCTTARVAVEPAVMSATPTTTTNTTEQKSNSARYQEKLGMGTKCAKRSKVPPPPYTYEYEYTYKHEHE